MVCVFTPAGQGQAGRERQGEMGLETELEEEPSTFIVWSRTQGPCVLDRSSITELHSALLFMTDPKAQKCIVRGVPD